MQEPTPESAVPSSDGSLKGTAIALSILSLAITVLVLLFCVGLTIYGSTLNHGAGSGVAEGVGIFEGSAFLFVWVPCGLIPGISALICWAIYSARKARQSSSLPGARRQGNISVPLPSAESLGEPVPPPLDAP